MSVVSQNSLEKPCICFDAMDVRIRGVYFVTGESPILSLIFITKGV